MRPSVTLVVNAAAHSSGLAEALVRAGMARAIVRFMPELEILEPGPDGSLVVTRRLPVYRFGGRVLWAIWRRLPTDWRRFVPFLEYGRIADFWIARHLPRSDVFQPVLGACVTCCRRARRLGAAVLLDNPFLHVAAFQREALTDCADAGFPLVDRHRCIGAAELRQWQWQYQNCDRILVSSVAAARTFEPYPYAGKVALVHFGVNHRLFVPAPRTKHSGAFRVCYLGRVEAPKGVHHLIAAWKQLSLPDAELVLAGRVMPEMEWLRKEDPAARITLRGILSPEVVVQTLQESELFVFPSVNEGFSRAVLEAMSCGLPAIACRDTGAADCITHGVEGLLVPGRDAGALAEAIRWCYQHRNELPAMGQAARKRVEENFTLSHYESRMIELYRSVTTERSGQQ
ncbi:MAG TPA: glycosyltransferase family 4 protein [Bryobacteraceae bacterium]|nr:glycosyltransferase family 4 protein [Bryobacteraceae bacterium]